MIYLINNIRQHERHFWNCLHSVASQEQIQRILDGHKVIISDTIYQIQDKHCYLVLNIQYHTFSLLKALFKIMLPFLFIVFV